MGSNSDPESPWQDLVTIPLTARPSSLTGICSSSNNMMKIQMQMYASCTHFDHVAHANIAYTSVPRTNDTRNRAGWGRLDSLMHLQLLRRDIRNQWNVMEINYDTHLANYLCVDPLPIRRPWVYQLTELKVTFWA